MASALVRGSPVSTVVGREDRAREPKDLGGASHVRRASPISDGTVRVKVLTDVAEADGNVGCPGLPSRHKGPNNGDATRLRSRTADTNTKHRAS